MKIATEHLDNLVALGYTPEEAQFLYIVATHSGYFTDQQFLDFSGSTSSQHREKFLAKLLSRKHATCHLYPGGGRVYHIFAMTIVRAIGRDGLRTRRRHQLDYIKTRLVTLDFVLANLHYEYLETEAEKVPFFESRLDVSRSLLPCHIYRSKASSRGAVRYFVDRFPIFLKDSALVSPGVCLTYIDTSSVTLQGFVTHLHAYRGLLRALPRFEFLYIAPTDRFFESARAEFSRLVLSSPRAPSCEKILRYFHLRKRWETGERVAAAEVVSLNAAERELKNEKVEALYAEWSRGMTKEYSVPGQLGAPRAQVHGTFVAQRYGRSLAVFDPSGTHREEAPNQLVPVTGSPKPRTWRLAAMSQKTTTGPRPSAR